MVLIQFEQLSVPSYTSSKSKKYDFFNILNSVVRQKSVGLSITFNSKIGP